MASTTALFSGLSGLSTNSRRLDVIGNNIANLNTTAYKSNRMQFSPLFSRNLTLGSAPSETTGGLNPGQIGLGVKFDATQRSFINGSVSATGNATDVAIEGDGFFIVEQNSQQIYTRSGAFQRNLEADLVTSNGGRVMGFGIDNQFNIVKGSIKPINIPLGTLTLAEATREVTYSGNLNASGVVGSTGSLHETRAFYTDLGITPAVGTTNLEDGSDDLFIDDGAGGYSLAVDGGEGAMITIDGVEKAGKDLGSVTFAFSAVPVVGADAIGSTMDDFVSFLDQYLGLDSTSISGQTLGGGVTLDPSGQIIITGNEGTVQDLDIDTADIVVSYPPGYAGAGINQPFVMTKTGTADGESVGTTFVVYDSLGTPLTVDLTFVLQENVSGAGSVWEFIVESTDNDATERVVGLGVVEFDERGEFVSASNQQFSITRTNGAISPLTVGMQFDTGSDRITALTDTSSALAAIGQNGSPIGTLASFSIGADGLITGSFTNGLARTLGQVALAKFANPSGVVDIGSGSFTTGPASGNPVITSPTSLGTGRLIGGALELSNVDLSQEFINMILASTGYSASSRVISTTDELIDQLLVLGR